MKSFLVINLFLLIFLIGGLLQFFIRLTSSVIVQTFFERAVVQEIPRNLVRGSSSGKVGGCKTLTSIKLSSTRELYLKI